MDTAEDLASVVAKRRAFLDALLEEPRSKPDLVERTDRSRSTVDRAVSELVEHGLVAREGHRYRATATGKWALSVHERYMDRLADIDRAGEVIRSLPPDAEFDPRILYGADVQAAEPHAQEYPLDRSKRIIDRAREVRVVGHVVTPTYIELAHESAVENGVDLHMVVSPEVQATIEREHAAELAEMADAATVDLYQVPDPPPYVLWTAETPEKRWSGLNVHSDTGIRGVIVNDTERMNEWARSVFETYLERAEPVG